MAKEARRKLKEERQRKKERKRNKKIRIEKECIAERMNCFRYFALSIIFAAKLLISFQQNCLFSTSHDSNHWRTAPTWNDEPFCFCMNANNNTYSCVRTINQTHNFLYCEFTTGLVTFYNLRIGWYIWRNTAIYSIQCRLLSLHFLFRLHRPIRDSKSCGISECRGTATIAQHIGRIEGVPRPRLHTCALWHFQ